jgi:hypothetical protein
VEGGEGGCGEQPKVESTCQRKGSVMVRLRTGVKSEGGSAGEHDERTAVLLSSSALCLTCM